MDLSKLQSFVTERDNIFQITFSAAPIGMALMHRDGHFLMVNPAFLEMLAYTEQEFLALTIADITHPDDIQQTNQFVGKLYAGEFEGDRFQLEKRYLHKDGSVLWGVLSVSLVRDDTGEPICSMGQVINITENKRDEAIRQGRTVILEKLASGASLEQILALLVEKTQTIWPEILCSVMVLDEQGHPLLYGATQSLADYSSQATDQVESGERVGSRGTVVSSGERVVVTDILSQPYWIDPRELSSMTIPGVCWSQPILSSAGKVLGAFDICYNRSCEPEQAHLDYIESAAHLAWIAIEKFRTENAIRESEAKYRDLVETSQDLIWLVDAEGKWTFVNRSAAETIYGYQPEEMLGRPFNDFVSPGQRHEDLEAFTTLKRGESLFDYETVHLRRDGRPVYLNYHAILLRNERGDILGATGTARDVSEYHRAAEEIQRYQSELETMVETRTRELRETNQLLFEEKERAQVTLTSIGDAVISTDAEGRIDFLNPIAENLTGWSADEAQGRNLADIFRIINEETGEAEEDPVSRCLQEDMAIEPSDKAVLVSRSGARYAIEDSAAPIRSRDGSLLGVVQVFRDVTKARQLSQKVSYQASHDALTGLLNRREFERRLQRVLATAQSSATENALCYLDLDQFKLVNDTSGHVAGDELLRQVGQLLQQQIRKRDTLARLGGDEFGLLMEHCSLTEAKGVAENLIKAIGDFSFPWEEHSFSIGVSIGLAAVNRYSAGIHQLMSAADTACYIAKEQGRNRLHVHHTDDTQLARRYGEMQWAVRLPRALEEERFQLYFQSIIPIVAKYEKPRMSHYEILLQMRDEEGQLVPPGAFLPAAERYNLSERLDRWVIRQAFRWLGEHPRKLQQLHICSINLSGLSLSNQSFLSFIIHEMELAGLAPEKICFEIAETVAIANLSSAKTFIEVLKKRGCLFALDDFGSGLSSFTYLKNLPVDFLKIDGALVKHILRNPMDFAMVKSINEIGHVMGKQIIAECVENDATLEKLREIGVDYAQGYGIARPCPLNGQFDQ